MITIDGQSYLDCGEVAVLMTGTVVIHWNSDDVRDWADRMEAQGWGDRIGLYRQPETKEPYFKDSAITATIALLEGDATY
jgi:hypothetical protein